MFKGLISKTKKTGKRNYPATGILFLFIVVCFFTDAESSASEEKYSLVKRGVPQCSVILGKDALPPEQHASEELRCYLGKVSGAEIPEVSSRAGAPASFPIFLGTPDSSSAVKEFRLLSKVKNLSDEGFIIQTSRKGLIIAGKKPMGVLYGVYSFLEEQIGIRWFFPGEEGEYCPKESTITIGKIKETQNPGFTTRTLNLTCTRVGAQLTDTWNWMARNKMQIQTSYHPWAQYAEELRERGAKMQGGGHCLTRMVPPTKYFDEHPEYFPLINGKRMPCNYEGKVYQLCTSNPKVVDLAVEYINSFFGEGRQGDIFRFGNNDGNGWCECESCRALDHPWETNHGYVSTRFYRFVNEVAGRVFEKYPDKEIIGWGYQLFRTAPRGIKPDPRLDIMVAMHGRCYRHSYADSNCRVNAKLMEVLGEWSAFGNVTGTHEYYSCFIDDGYKDTPPYVPLEDIAAGDIKHLWSMGCKYWQAEVPPPDGSFGKRWNNPWAKENWRAQLPVYYVAAKLLWAPELDTEKIKDEFCEKYFAPAGKPMKSYRRLLSKLWRDTKEHFLYGGFPVYVGQSLTRPGTEEKLLKYLSVAQAGAGADKKIQKRIAAEKKYFNAIWRKAFRDFQKTSCWDEIIVRKRDGLIRIDGVLNEADWNGVEDITGFSNNRTLSPVQTFVKMLYDDEYVYFGITCMEPSVDTLKMRYSTRDEPIWKDDAIELFIDPQGSGEKYFHFAVNPKGAFYDAECEPGGLMEKGFNADCKTAGRVLSDRWILEVRIKADSLNAGVAEGIRWKLTVARSRRPGGKMEASTWSDGSFHNPSAFRSVFFAEPPLLKNGGFEKTVKLTTEGLKKRYNIREGGWVCGENLFFPALWSVHGSHPGKAAIINDDTHSGKNAWKIEKGWVAHYFSASTGETLQIDFWAKGEAPVRVMLFQYTRNARGRQTFKTTDIISDIEPGPQWCRYSFEHKIIRKKITRSGLAFAVTDYVVLDDVCVIKINQ